MRGTRRTRTLLTVVGTVVLSGAVLAPTSAPAAGVDTRARAEVDVITVGDPAMLPQGDPPRLPYIDRAAKRIHDGSRTVDISGLVGIPIRLHKVNGGYVVNRSVGRNGQLVFISNSGRRVLWERNYYDDYYHPVAVSSQGGRIVYQRGNHDTQATDTVVRDVRDGHVVTKRRLGSVFGYRGRVLVNAPGNKIVWWTPGKSRLETVASGLENVFGADVTASQIFRQGQMVSFPPGTRPSWEPNDDSYGYDLWSPDDSLLSGFENNFDRLFGPSIVDAATGAEVARIVMDDSTDKLTWEDNDHVLVTDRTEGGGFWLVRCSLSTKTCERVRKQSDGVFTVATRRNS